MIQEYVSISADNDNRGGNAIIVNDGSRGQRAVGEINHGWMCLHQQRLLHKTMDKLIIFIIIIFYYLAIALDHCSGIHGVAECLKFKQKGRWMSSPGTLVGRLVENVDMYSN